MLRPNAPCPLPPACTYARRYAHENPFWGHFGTDPATGQLFGAWFTPLGGVTEGTSAANFGVGPNHQVRAGVWRAGGCGLGWCRVLRRCRWGAPR